MTTTPKKLQNWERAQDLIVRKRSQTWLKCSYQQHVVNILRSKASPVFPPEQHWARASLEHRLLITHVASTANLAPARSSFSPKYTWWPREEATCSQQHEGKGSWALLHSRGNPKHTRAWLNFTRSLLKWIPRQIQGSTQMEKHMHIFFFQSWWWWWWW